MKLHELLSEREIEPLLLLGDRPLSSAEMVDAAHGIAKAVSNEGPLLVWSDDTSDVIAACVAANLSGRGLFVAHASLRHGLIEEIASRHGVAGVVRRLGVEDRPGSFDQHSDRLVVMTSGTTGTPKMIQHTLDTLTSTIRSTQTSRQARWLLTYAPTTFAGLQVIFSALIGGGVLVAPTDRSFEGFAKAASIHAVTHISGTPTFWRGLLMTLGDRGVPLVQATLGGEAPNERILGDIGNRFPCAALSQIYATTELGVIFTVSDGRPGFPAAWTTDPEMRPRLRVVDGVLEVRSSRRMEGYISDHSQSVDQDGWIRTGDLVGKVGDRYIFEGREDLLINVGGYKVRPEEVEAALLRLPGVEEARVYGRDTPITGQIVAAELVLSEGIADAERYPAKVQAQMRSVLEAYKVPRLIEIVDSVEMASGGKKARR